MCSYQSFSLSCYLEPQIIFPCRDIGPATATLDPRPRALDPRARLWTHDRDFGPATRDPRLLVKLLRRSFGERILGVFGLYSSSLSKSLEIRFRMASFSKMSLLTCPCSRRKNVEKSQAILEHLMTFRSSISTGKLEPLLFLTFFFPVS